MDKRVIFAVAGSGKTTYIVDSITKDKRYLIITYTDVNYDNLVKKIANKNGGYWPENVTLMRYFPFLYQFCYKPFLSDLYKARGINFESNPNRHITQDKLEYYLTPSRFFYSNRLSLFLEKTGVINDIKERITTYFDTFIIDEVQDIAGRDFTFLEKLMEADVDMLFVGDFFQHTYDTSRDGNVNKGLFSDRKNYENRFRDRGVIPDCSTLLNSWRCSPAVCDYVSANLGIAIHSNRTDDTTVQFVSDKGDVEQIMENDCVVKLHYRNSSKFGGHHLNWGETKGEDGYQDICVMLNKETMKKYRKGELAALAPSTRNKLYVAITRARGNVYLVEE